MKKKLKSSADGLLTELLTESLSPADIKKIKGGNISFDLVAPAIEVNPIYTDEPPEY
jgi:hypothetical protein